MDRRELEEATKILLKAESVLGGLAAHPRFERLALHAHKRIQAVLVALDKIAQEMPHGR